MKIIINSPLDSVVIEDPNIIDDSVEEILEDNKPKSDISSLIVSSDLELANNNLSKVMLDILNTSELIVIDSDNLNENSGNSIQEYILEMVPKLTDWINIFNGERIALVRADERSNQGYLRDEVNPEVHLFGYNPLMEYTLNPRFKYFTLIRSTR